MIQKECFTTEWIDKVSAELDYRDKNLIEKVIRALSLLEMLAQSGCPLIFKGGTALVLILGKSAHRLSIDIDIICPPGTNIENYLISFANYGFTDLELVERKQRGDVPKSHSKFFYQIAYRSGSNVQSYILLDVFCEDCHYFKTEQIAINSPFICLDGEPVMVRVPSVEDILGDKLTAFAPNTTGIPYYKGDKCYSLEISKQLYDIGRLFELVLFNLIRWFYGPKDGETIDLIKKHLSDILIAIEEIESFFGNKPKLFDDFFSDLCLRRAGKFSAR